MSNKWQLVLNECLLWTVFKVYVYKEYVYSSSYNPERGKWRLQSSKTLFPLLVFLYFSISFFWIRIQLQVEVDFKMKSLDKGIYISWLKKNFVLIYVQNSLQVATKQNHFYTACISAA